MATAGGTARTALAHGFHDARLQAYAVGAAKRTPFVEVALSEAIGRVLGVELRSRTDLPMTPTSAVDGWAVAGEGPWKVIEGPIPQQIPELEPGTAVAIAAGAPLPGGTRSVLRRKDGNVTDAVIMTHRLPPGRDIRPAGEECLAGEVLISAGTMLTPPMVGLAAAAGWETLNVARRPDIEIVILRGDPRDPLGPQLPAWISSYGAYVTGAVRYVDQPPRALTHLGPAADLTVLVASTAASGREELRAALSEVEAEILIDGISVRPGHPVTLALMPSGRIVVGLPATPQSALLGVVMLLGPVIAGLQGRILGPLHNGRLDQAIPGRGADTVLRPVVRSMTPGVYSPVDYVGAGMLRGIAMADGVAVIPPRGRHAGAMVEILPMPWSSPLG